MKNIKLFLFGKILLKIQDEEDIFSLLSGLNAEEMKEVRDFLEEELIYLSQLRDKTPIQTSEIKSSYEPIPNYYYKQNCREPLESCINETCLYANPQCFNNKMKLQIEVLVRLLKPYLRIK